MNRCKINCNCRFVDTMRLRNCANKSLSILLKSADRMPLTSMCWQCVFCRKYHEYTIFLRWWHLVLSPRLIDINLSYRYGQKTVSNSQYQFMQKYVLVVCTERKCGTKIHCGPSRQRILNNFPRKKKFEHVQLNKGETVNKWNNQDKSNINRKRHH